MTVVLTNRFCMRVVGDHQVGLVESRYLVQANTESF